MKNRKPVLAILGGAGHHAAARLHEAILARFSANATNDGDYPEVIVFNRPFPGVGLGGIEDASLAAASLEQRLTQAAAVGATHTLLACASLHVLPPARKCVDWLGLAPDRLAGGTVKKVGVVASASARRAGLFEKVLAPCGLEVVYPDQQGLCDHVIAQCIPGIISPSGRRALSQITDGLAPRVDCIWHACTDLSAIELDGSSNVICSLDLMVEASLHALGDLT